MTIYEVWGMMVAKIHVLIFLVMTLRSLLNDDDNDDYLRHNYHE
jgi:hypothetical protein